MKKLRETEYVYAAARIHTVDGALLGREKYSQLAAAPSEEAFLRILGELGYKTDGDIFRALEEKLAEAFGFVADISPDPHVFDALRFPYDCCNLKAAIKCEFISGFDFSSLYSPSGTISEKDVASALKNRDFSVFPENMSKTAPCVIDEYAKTGDPQLIDLRLDAACCADMIKSAMESGESSLIGYVRDRADCVNLLTALRVIRMNKDEAFFSEAMVPGGSIGTDILKMSVSDGSEAELIRAMKNTPYEGLLGGEQFPSFAETERIFDDRTAELIKKHRHDVFGAASLLWYLCASENEVKNIRMIIAGHAGAQPAEKIIERIRESYV